MKRFRQASPEYIPTLGAALQSKDTLLDQADLFQILFTDSPVPAWIYERDTNAISAVNAAAVREFGYSEQDFLGMSMAAIRPEPTCINDADKRLFLRKNGSSLRGKTRTHAVLWNGKPCCLCMLESILGPRSVPDDFRLLASSAADANAAVFVTDATQEAAGPSIVFVNAGVSQLTGYSAEELVGRPLEFFQTPASDCVPTEQTERNAGGEGSFTYQVSAVHRNGSKYSAECHVTPLRDEFGNTTHYLHLQRDVTERNRLQEQLSQSEKMEAVGRLAGGVAHDFNNLLTIILGYSGLLALEMKNPRAKDKGARNLCEIQKAAEKAAVLTSQLLAFSRKQVFRPTVVALNPVIKNIEGMLRRLIGEDVDLHFVLDPDLGTVFTDAGQVEQVLMNLSVNARDAMPRGGTLVIETCNKETAPQDAATAGMEPGQYVLLTITDSGVGMDAETRARVFEPFFTTKESGRGTGLGLSMTHGFVKRSGGVIKIYSELGRGACFKIYLPRADSKAQQEHGLVAVEPPRGAGTIMVVEDDCAIRELVHEMLAGAGYEVLIAGSGNEAMEVSRRHSAPLDLLLTDVVLPGISGPDLAAKLRMVQPGLRVLFASGYSDHALVRQGMLENGEVFVQKPFNAGALLQLVSDMTAPRTLRVSAC